jgi:hypothetical protein
MTERVVEQIALGVSTRGYERSLEPVDESIETRGASKSNASRALIDATTEKLSRFVSRKLYDVGLVAMRRRRRSRAILQRCQVHKARHLRGSTDRLQAEPRVRACDSCPLTE